ncbi:hypothetical protein BIV57_20725 [Mangrovactinospora gilvigrisea]|uniref:Uncharacterized protein n=1 Tax=Mangrovactinospora gilvigrisea TaxID=1428644 RepID=A0A1J7BQ76_9ACTN|nr:HGxxPAAW family protein [Mangrovactinospora gilvigrisea]OIV35601.1 hypothetical protein BIV57_20725 [Mangrovactinospora gilvigrisea]
MSSSSHASEHGHSPAAWTGVTIVFIGFMIAAVGVVGAMLPILYVGLAVILGGAVVGKVMSSAGLGVNGRG